MSAPGLTQAEAAARLAVDGPNELQRERATSKVRLLLGQFKSPVIWLLLGACVVSALLKELVDSIAIGSIVIVNGLVGFFQEYRAERAVLALRSMTAPRARVLRDGQPKVIPAVEVVGGDVLLLEAGDIVSADGKLLEANVLTTNEAPLTGESLPVSKALAPSAKGAALAERTDQVFTGTSVVAGTGQAIVTATGMKTELGKIAHLLATAEVSVTPLQRRLAKVSQMLLFVCLAIVAVIGVLGLVRHSRCWPSSCQRSRWPWRPSPRGCPRSSPSRWRSAFGAWPRGTCWCAGCLRSRRSALRPSSAPTRRGR